MSGDLRLSVSRSSGREFLVLGPPVRDGQLRTETLNDGVSQAHLEQAPTVPVWLSDLSLNSGRSAEDPGSMTEAQAKVLDFSSIAQEIFAPLDHEQAFYDLTSEIILFYRPFHRVNLTKDQEKALGRDSRLRCPMSRVL